MSSAVVLKNISKSFYNTKLKQMEIVLNDISLSAQHGEVTVLMGQSGCGKSTLFRILIGEETADSGHVSILDKQIFPLNKKNLQDVKKKFGILFQYGALFNSMNVGHNISFPILEHQPQLHRNVVSIMVDNMLRQVSLDPDKYKHKMPAMLSGGERKRVGLARALALDPKLIFYDEPSAGLDPIVSRTIDKLIKNLVKMIGIASVVITHELDSAFTIADRMIILKRAVVDHGDDWEGTIVYEEGKPEDLRNSKKPYTVEFLGEFSHHNLCKFCRFVQQKHFETCEACGKSQDE